MRQHPPPSPGRRERGVALLTALVLMFAVLMTGISAARGALQGARAAAHERDRVLALQMADAALLDAERDIEGGAQPGSARANAIASGSPDAFVAGCGAGRPYGGLCAPGAAPHETAALLADDDGPAVPFGSHTGASMPGGEGGLPAQAPRYLIELVPAPPAGPAPPGPPLPPGQPPAPGQPGGPAAPPAPGQPSTPGQPTVPGQPTIPDQPPIPGEPPAPGQPLTPPETPTPGQPSRPAEPPPGPPPPGSPTMPGPPTMSGQLYLITARGVGSMPGTQAALQAYYRKPDGAPGRRVGWRELGNWSALYPAASPAVAPPGN